MSERRFVDFYEVLQISPRADKETVDKVFRHLAKRLHPDNQTTGDRDAFEELVDAHRVLSDPEERAAYDVRYEEGRASQWGMVETASEPGAYDNDRLLRDRLLSLLYVQRRRDVDDPSMGNIELERLLSCPAEHLEFHMWYLKEKKLVERTSRGVAITALGIDEAEASGNSMPRERLLAARAESHVERENRKQIEPGSDE